MSVCYKGTVHQSVRCSRGSVKFQQQQQQQQQQQRHVLGRASFVKDERNGIMKAFWALEKSKINKLLSITTTNNSISNLQNVVYRGGEN